MTRVIGYVRVSTQEQATEGVSLAAQRARLTAYCAAMDLQLVAIHEDAGVSAKTLDRPGLTAALAALDGGAADGLLIVKLDRLTRSVVDLGTLLERYFVSRYALMSVSDSIDTRSAAGRMVLNIMATVAQWEREAISERTSAALAHLKAQGVRLGGEPLGARPGEAETVQRIHALRAEGLTLADIAITLTHEGRPTKRGGKWGAETVRKVLMRNSGGQNVVC